MCLDFYMFAAFNYFLMNILALQLILKYNMAYTNVFI